MIERWFEDREFGISWEEFQWLPRHPSYRYEFHNERCRITLRPRYFQAVLDLTELSAISGARRLSPAEHVMRAPGEQDLPMLSLALADAFRLMPPFERSDEPTRHDAARAVLERMWAGRDGALANPASQVAIDAQDRCLGACLITLLPPVAVTDPLEGNAVDANSEQPEDTSSGQPHLTWIFVRPEVGRRGWGQRLLQSASGTLHRQGYRSLVSTFLLGNSSATLWHWKMGFKLLSHPASPSHILRT